MSQTIDIVSLYPKDMNIYGDSGNVLTIQRRLALYGYEPHVHAYNQGDAWPEHVDMILGGGGQDTGQKKIVDDFFKRINPSCLDVGEPFDGNLLIGIIRLGFDLADRLFWRIEIGHVGGDVFRGKIVLSLH